MCRTWRSQPSSGGRWTDRDVLLADQKPGRVGGVRFRPRQRPSAGVLVPRFVLLGGGLRTNLVWRLSGAAVLALTACGVVPTEVAEPPQVDAVGNPLVVGAASDLLPSADTYLRSDAPNKNYGGHDSLRIQKVGTGGANRALLLFDEEAIRLQVGGDSIVSAVISLTIRRNGNNWGASGRQLGAYRMNRAWTELGATWNCPADANTANGKVDCPGGDWTMQGPAFPFATTPTGQVTVRNGQTGAITLEVTQDVRAIVAGESQVAGWLVRLVVEAQQGTAVFGSREAGSQPRLTITTIGQFPALPPDADPPAEYYSNSVFHTPTSVSSDNFVVRPLINVRFESWATLEQRATAAATVEGAVVGGSRMGVDDGYYVLRVPDPGSIDSVEKLVSALNLQAGVAEALPEYLLGSLASYRVPIDGPGFTGADWTVLRSDPQGGHRTTPYVQANLPLAWGCATGAASVRVAVVDEGLIIPGGGELAPTIGYRANVSPGRDGTGHGTKVASILAARGNNRIGLTGVLWNSDLRVYDAVQLTPGGQVVLDPTGRPSASLRSVVNRVSRAALDGAQVINLSMSFLRPPSPSSADSALRRRAGSLLAKVLRPYPAATRPVLVLSAGNLGVDAWWAGFPQVKDSLSDHVIVVAASNRALTALSVLGSFDSNTGRLVEIAAPGDSVYALDLTGVPRSFGATSAAAPIVSGVVGLVLAFDPRLSPMQALAFTKQGAVRSGIGVSGVPLVDAREALVVAAEQAGSPVCGNVLRWEADALAVKRAFGYEAIGPWPATVHALFVAQHDGRTIAELAGGTDCRPVLE